MLKVSKQLKFKLITLVIAVVEHLNQTRYAKAAWENAYKLSEEEEANDPICQLIARNERQFQIEADYEEDEMFINSNECGEGKYFDGKYGDNIPF